MRKLKPIKVPDHLIAAYSAAMLKPIVKYRRDFHQAMDIWLKDPTRSAPAAELSIAPNKRLLEKISGTAIVTNTTQFNGMVKTMTGSPAILSKPQLAKMQEAWIAKNVDLITSIPEKFHAQVRAIMEDAVLRDRRPESLMQDLLSRYDVASSRARLIARDQLSKLNGDLNRANQESIGVEYYIWETVQDERVRDEPDDSHRNMQGMMCKWEDNTVFSDDGGATWQDREEIGGPYLEPGQDFQCRCNSTAIIPDTPIQFFDEDESEESPEPAPTNDKAVSEAITIDDDEDEATGNAINAQ